MTGRDGGELTTIEVETTTLGELVAAHGLPYYLKSDVEGADEFVIEQLETLSEMPPYVSVEASGDPLVDAGALRLRPFPDRQSGLPQVAAEPQTAAGRQICRAASR